MGTSQWQRLTGGGMHGQMWAGHEVPLFRKPPGRQQPPNRSAPGKTSAKPDPTHQGIFHEGKADFAVRLPAMQNHEEIPGPS